MVRGEFVLRVMDGVTSEDGAAEATSVSEHRAAPESEEGSAPETPITTTNELFSPPAQENIASFGADSAAVYAVGSAETANMFDVSTVLAMHHKLNEMSFSLLAERTGPMQAPAEGVKDEGGAPGVECTICLEPMEEGQLVTRVSCDHCFHHECLNTWMATKVFNEQAACCPNCNLRILEPLRYRDDAPRGAVRSPPPRMSRTRFLCILLGLIVAVTLCVILIPMLLGRSCRRGWEESKLGCVPRNKDSSSSSQEQKTR